MGVPKRPGLGIKVRMYFSSLWMLFVFLLVKDLNLDGLSMWHLDCNVFARNNCMALIWFALSFVSIAITCRIHSKWEEVSNFPRVIRQVRSLKSDYIVFLTTCIFPLLTYDTSEPSSLMLMVFIVVALGWLFIKTDMYYANPTLALIGYKLYEASVEIRPEKPPSNDKKLPVSQSNCDENVTSLKSLERGTSQASKKVVLLSMGELEDEQLVRWLELANDGSVWLVKS